MSKDLHIGDIIRLKSFRHYSPVDVKELKKQVPTPKFVILQADYSAAKDHVFIACLLGVEDKAGKHPIDRNAAFRRMGWQQPVGPLLIPIPIPLQHRDERLKTSTQYLAKIRSVWHTGQFEMHHYGWNFTGVFAAGFQLSWEGWEELYEIGESQ